MGLRARTIPIVARQHLVGSRAIGDALVHVGHLAGLSPPRVRVDHVAQQPVARRVQAGLRDDELDERGARPAAAAERAHREEHHRAAEQQRRHGDGPAARLRGVERVHVRVDARLDGGAVGRIGDALADERHVDRLAVERPGRPAVAGAGRPERERAEQGKDEVPRALALGRHAGSSSGLARRGRRRADAARREAGAARGCHVRRRTFALGSRASMAGGLHPHAQRGLVQPEVRASTRAGSSSSSGNDRTQSARSEGPRAGARAGARRSARSRRGRSRSATASCTGEIASSAPVRDRRRGPLGAPAPRGARSRSHARRDRPHRRDDRARRPACHRSACFDTAFHASLPARRAAPAHPPALRGGGRPPLRVPRALVPVARRAARRDAARGPRSSWRTSGAGSSLCAARDGVSVDTTMGFTPNWGIPMATRTGRPRSRRPGAPAADRGRRAPTRSTSWSTSSPACSASRARAPTCAISSRARARDPRPPTPSLSSATRVRKAIGALAAVLDGLDTLVFAGGIGENAPVVRARVCAGLSHLGIAIDPAANARDAGVISTDGERVHRPRRPHRRGSHHRARDREAVWEADDERHAPQDGRVLARRELPVRRADLPARQPAPARAAALRARQAAPARPLGDDAGAQLRLRARQPRHQGARPRRDLRHRPGARRARASSPTRGSRGPTARSTRTSRATRAGMQAALQAVLVPGRHPEPRRARDAGQHPRGRGARLRAEPRVRRGVRQPEAARLLRRRRRRGGDRARWRRAGTRTSSSNPVHDGAVLPILHLNGYKIAGPTVLARIPREELEQLLRGYGWAPRFVEGDDPAEMHAKMAAGARRGGRRDRAHPGRRARATAFATRPAWPMIVLRIAQGLDGPEEGRRRARSRGRSARTRSRSTSGANPKHLAMLEAWMKSYRPEELFDAQGRASSPSSLELPPTRRAAHERQPARQRRAAPQGPADARLREVRGGRARARAPSTPRRRACRGSSSATSSSSTPSSANFRVFSPDETASNRWNAVFEVTTRASVAEIIPHDDHVSPDGRVMEMLSEHQCEGWLEGYLLTGRHGFFSCYEAFIHIVDSMFNQHAKWLKVTRHIPWRRPIASLNYLLTSHVWRQDHNGFSHQDPGLHRPRRQQEGRRHPRLPAAGRQHAPQRDRPLPAQRELRQRHRRRQAARAAVAHDGPGHQALHRGARHLGLGEQRRRAATPTS